MQKKGPAKKGCKKGPTLYLISFFNRANVEMCSGRRHVSSSPLPAIRTSVVNLGNATSVRDDIMRLVDYVDITSGLTRKQTMKRRAANLAPDPVLNDILHRQVLLLIEIDAILALQSATANHRREFKGIRVADWLKPKVQGRLPIRPLTF